MAKLDKVQVCGEAKREGESWEDYHKRESAWMRTLEEKSAKVDPEGDLTGALIRFHVADGYAAYVVHKAEPLTLRHVKFMDEYQADAATIRGVNKNTVRTQLMRQRAFASMEDTNKTFYDSLEIGQIVHYHGGFGAWQRCEVTLGTSPHAPGRQKVLRPVALVGEWRPYDLPKRMPDGSVNMGSAAQGIAEGKTMTPHESCIWESPRCANKARMIADGFKDPATLEPVSLKVPAMTPEEEAKAALWRKVARLRAICNDRVEDPQQILDAVRQAVA